MMMREWEAGELLDGEIDKAVRTVADDGTILCTYAVHRSMCPPSPMVVNPMAGSAEESQRVRSMVRCLSDVLSGEAVTMVAPIVISSPSGTRFDGIIGAVSWRGVDGETTVGRIQAMQVIRDDEGKISQIKPFNSQGIESFILAEMDGVISPVTPDPYSIAHARGILESQGFPEELIGPEDTDEALLSPPTVH